MSTLEFRTAARADVPAIVAMLADDPLGATREKPGDPLPDSYWTAFDAIEADPNNELLVATVGGELAGVLQITFTPHLARQGAWRATIEGVRVAGSMRGHGIGGRLLAEAIERARSRHCRIVQLTTDTSRTEARQFYERLGFAATHHGMKLNLTD